MSEAEFLVRGVSSGGDGVLVSGIVNKGSIANGVTFSLLRARDASEQKVELVVTKIVTYSREVTELPSGMSGDLYLDGFGIELIQGRDMLVG
jgi:hypothetical protein